MSGDSILEVVRALHHALEHGEPFIPPPGFGPWKAEDSDTTEKAENSLAQPDMPTETAMAVGEVGPWISPPNAAEERVSSDTEEVPDTPLEICPICALRDADEKFRGKSLCGECREELDEGFERKVRIIEPESSVEAAERTAEAEGTASTEEPEEGTDARDGRGQVRAPPESDDLSDPSFPFEIVDKRGVGGALWVVGGPEIEGDLLDRFPGQKFTFLERGAKATAKRPAWWTK